MSSVAPAGLHGMRPEPTTLMTGLALGESPRWHDDRLWFADWGAQQVVAVDLDGRSEVVLGVQSLPFSIDWLPDGRLLVVTGGDGTLLRCERDGSLVTHADLSGLSSHAWNEIVVDGRGNAYVNTIGFDFATGQDAASGSLALVRPDGSAHQVADCVSFPNGMVVTRCVRVREGGEVLQTVLDRGCFACMLGGPDGRTLFVMTAEWSGPEGMGDGARTGRVVTVAAPAPGVGWP